MSIFEISMAFAEVDEHFWSCQEYGHGEMEGTHQSSALGRQRGSSLYKTRDRRGRLGLWGRRKMVLWLGRRAQGWRLLGWSGRRRGTRRLADAYLLEFG